MTENPSMGAGTLRLGGDLPVNRLGFGAMRLCGPGVWGEPEDQRAAEAVLRRAIELGINLIDTAYGPGVNERQISQALHPYPENLVIATKGGYTRQGPGRWRTNGRPKHLREACEREGVAFIPWFPLATGKLARPGGALDGISSRHGATPAQVALAWLLAKSPVMLPIPGTFSVEHLEENVAAAGLRLTDAEVGALSG